MANLLHDKVFEFLEEYRSSNPDFVYWLRERNTKNRLTDGFWFQGNEDYVFVGLYDHSGGSNKTRSIGLYFFPAPNDSVTCSVEVVYNEEKDQQVLKLYDEIKKLSGNFKRIADTRFREDLSGNGFASAEIFLTQTRPSIDALIKKLKLNHFFIRKSDFDQKLAYINSLRNKPSGKLFPLGKIGLLKSRYEEFKNDEFYIQRIKQLQFIPFAKKIITNSLKNELTNETFTGLIQILKNGAKADTVNYYINKNITDLNLRSELNRQFSEFGFTGYTGAGKAVINGLDNDQLQSVKVFILDCAAIKTKEEAVKRIEQFDALRIPQIKCGVYSPWLYYMNPSVFPIKNNSHDRFIEWCEQPTASYPLSILLFHEVADILGEKDLGLIDAFTHMFVDSSDKMETQIYSGIIEITAMSLNTILYGPPGTGKTYNTINKAVAIAKPEFDIAGSSRDKLKEEYERLVKEGQIEFITFHQSMSYEDFIEGIKPVEPKEGDDFLKYEIKEGIFKRLCERAIKVPETKPAGFSISEEEFQKAGFYKMSLGDTSNPDDDQIFEWCIKNGYIALGRGDVIDFGGMTESDVQQMVPGKLDRFSAQSINYFIHYAKKNDYVIVTYGNLQFRAIGKITGNYEFKNVEGLQVHQFRKVEWLWSGSELPYEEIYDRQFQQQSIYKMDKRGIKKEFLVKSDNAVAVKGKIKNYVLIIDEINRGNVSQIFGELITLIEDDKRAGRGEALTVTLPYSKKPFSVPSNLYIIGTMNTADRSVEALDTALRRRFTFEEMKPLPESLHPNAFLCSFWNKFEYLNLDYDNWVKEPYKTVSEKFYELIGLSRDQERLILNKEYDTDRMYWIPDDFESVTDEWFTGLRLDLLLESVNQRLEVLLSKDHTIGHAWLMNVFSLTDLQAVFRTKIIPLLQEFFYNDYVKIGLVLGDAFVKQQKVEKRNFARFKDEHELAAEYEDKVIYTLADPYRLELKDFIAIYQ